MKALVKSRAQEGLWLEDVPEPEVGPMDVLIKIKKTFLDRIVDLFIMKSMSCKTRETLEQ